MTYPRSLALLLPLALLAGCDKPSKNDKRSASGEVLQGTISDAMLPLEQLKSQPPLLSPSKAGATPEGVQDEATGDADVTAESSAEVEVAAAPSPSPSATP